MPMQKALSGVMNLLQANADKTTLFEESSYLLKELMESISQFQMEANDYFVIEEKRTVRSKYSRIIKS